MTVKWTDDYGLRFRFLYFACPFRFSQRILFAINSAGFSFGFYMVRRSEVPFLNSFWFSPKFWLSLTTVSLIFDGTKIIEVAIIYLLCCIACQVKSPRSSWDNYLDDEYCSIFTPSKRAERWSCSFVDASAASAASVSLVRTQHTPELVDSGTLGNSAATDRRYTVARHLSRLPCHRSRTFSWLIHARCESVSLGSSLSGATRPVNMPRQAKLDGFSIYWTRSI